MKDENWKEEFKKWNPTLKPWQIKLLAEGAKSQSQSLTLAEMWCEWKEIAVKKIYFIEEMVLLEFRYV